MRLVKKFCGKVLALLAYRLRSGGVCGILYVSWTKVRFLRMDNQTVLVLDFGGQYNQLIARRVRECNVYCELLPYSTPAETIRGKHPIGIILTGGPNSVFEPGAPRLDEAVLRLGVPILGICYGSQLIAHMLGGKVSRPVDFDDTEREVMTRFNAITGAPDYQGGSGIPNTVYFLNAEHTEYVRVWRGTVRHYDSAGSETWLLRP